MRYGQNSDLQPIPRDINDLNASQVEIDREINKARIDDTRTKMRELSAQEQTNSTRQNLVIQSGNLGTYNEREAQYLERLNNISNQQNNNNNNNN